MAFDDPKWKYDLRPFFGPPSFLLIRLNRVSVAKCQAPGCLSVADYAWVEWANFSGTWVCQGCLAQLEQSAKQVTKDVVRWPDGTPVQGDKKISLGPFDLAANPVI